MVKFTYTILYVKDVAKSITFYEQAFGFVRKFITPDNSYGELLTGETTISFATIEQSGGKTVRDRVRLCHS
jgi:lactoylglutathione lyase